MDYTTSTFTKLRPGVASSLRAAMPLLLLATSVGTASAALTATPSTLTLSCTTTGGPGAAASVVVKPSPLLTGASTIAVTLGTLPAGVVAVSTPALQTLSTANQAAGIVYVVNYAAGCAGASAGSGAVTFRLRADGTDDATVTVNRSVIASTSALVATPTTVTITA
jgi:hypothetical protein